MTAARTDPQSPAKSQTPAAGLRVPLRPPAEVMRLHRLGAAHPTRLSFMRSLIRALAAEGSGVARTLWQIDGQGHGRAVLTVGLGGHRYSLVAFSQPLEPERRTDRVIAEAWDTTYVLYDGIPDAAEIERLAANVPLQEAGRFRESELVLCRANRSVRFFDHVTGRLAQGLQPDAELTQSVGYLMRTTAVYGNGKFGIADRAVIAGRPGLSGPFAAEMLTVWLIRGFTLDLAEHVARARSPSAASMAPHVRRFLGIGNATGLGMAPFLVNHPLLLHNWIAARETALARVRSVARTTSERLARAAALAVRAAEYLEGWRTDDARQSARIDTLRREWPDIGARLAALRADSADPWEALWQSAAPLSVEAQELLAALLIEAHGDLVDDLAACMAAPPTPRLNPAATTRDLARAARAVHGDALGTDFADPENEALFWYVSEEKLEPRLGLRHEEPGADLEQPLDTLRAAQALLRDLPESSESVARFLLHHPEHRHTAQRLLLAAEAPYSEIRDNLIGRDCLPIDMLRLKLSFFGASRFDPKSDRWTRVTLFSGAPGFGELGKGDPDDWWLRGYGA